MFVIFLTAGITSLGQNILPPHQPRGLHTNLPAGTAMQPTLIFFQGLLYDLLVHSNSAPLHAQLQPMTCGDQHPSVIPRINSAFMPRFQLADVVNSPRKSKSWAPLIRLLRSPNHLQNGTNVNGLLATILHFGPKGIIIYILTGLLYFSPARMKGNT